MKHKLKRSLISSISVLALTAVLVDVSYGYDGLVESCSVNTSTDSGGVSLNKTLTLLNSMGDIQGAAYDPKKGRIVFTSLGGADVVLEDDDPITRNVG